jgi:hypothetical protein
MGDCALAGVAAGLFPHSAEKTEQQLTVVGHTRLVPPAGERLDSVA